MDKLLDEQRIEFDPAKRKAMLSKIQTIAVEDAHWLYLYEGIYAAAFRDEILSPMISIASGGGPIQATPRSLMARAKSAFSEKNP